MRNLIVVVLLLVVVTVVFARLGHVRRGNQWESGQGKHISRSRNGRRSRDSRDDRDGRDWRDLRPRHPRRGYPPRSRPSNPPRTRPSNPPRPRYPYNPNHWINSQYTRPRNSDEKFPRSFKFGAVTNAYGVEGAYNVTPGATSVWDNATNQYPQLIADGSNGNDASLSYYFYDQDVKAAKEIDLDFYYFGMSWSRLMPDPKKNETNPDGVKFYNDLINKLMKKGIEPICHLTQFDEPEILARYGGYTNPCFIDDFVNYAETVFRLFGDRVKAWVTFDQANIMCNQYYDNGNLDPVIKVWPGVTGYLCYKNILIAHARAYRLYKKKYNRYGGKVGIGMYTRGFFKNPDNGTDEDVQKAWDFDTIIGYPIFSNTSDCGNWNPAVVAAIEERSSAENRFESRLPPIPYKEQKEICGSADFLACFYFTSRYVQYAAEPAPYAANDTFYTPDAELEYTTDPSWQSSDVSWAVAYAPGLGFVLQHTKDQLGNCDVLVLNGWANLCQQNDIDRISYLSNHTQQVLEQVRNGTNVCAYGVYALIDGFEDRSGYTVCTGLYSVDFQSPQRTRTARRSSYWYHDLIESRTIPPVPT